DLVVRPIPADPPDYSAVDSGYVAVEYRYFKLYIIDIVVVKNKIYNKTIFLNIKKNEKININRKARELELREIEGEGPYVLLDGPLTPYVGWTDRPIVGVSKDPVAPRYGRALGGEAGEWFEEISALASELYAAELLLRGEPYGAMLKPVKVSGLRGTYVKGDSVFYVEFPGHVPEEVVASFFRHGYPVKLRIAHKYARITREYLNTVKTILPRLLGGASNRYRDYL
ncbi:MAG: DNA double-strand break repair nuclease NurA, partial [Thermoproteus sp.]|nr:DNA double-strand break repair nuclease NurA [Thermoproteus sp.]